MGISKKKANNIIDQIVTFAEIDEFIDTPVQNYSSGMQVRLGFAIAAHVNPQLLLVDEALAVGDMKFQRKCLQYMTNYLENKGSIILVSHNMHLIQSICSQCLIIDQGTIKFSGSVTEGISTYYNMHNASRNEFITNYQDEIIETQALVIEKVDISTAEGGEVKTAKTLI